MGWKWDKAKPSNIIWGDKVKAVIRVLTRKVR